MNSLEELKKDNVFHLKKIYKDDKKVINLINHYMNNNEDVVVESMLDLCNKIDDLNISYSSDIKEVIYLMLKDICLNEGCQFSDINLISDSGSYSVVFGIKDKVFKLGNERETIYFPNNPYIIKPIVRRYLVDKKTNNKLFVEIVEKANIDSLVSVDELYEVYKNMRELGLVWTDVNLRNVGRLLKDNRIHWNRSIGPSDNTLYLKESRDDKILKTNDVVIIDADYIYDENDTNIKVVDNSYYCAFEYQYNIDKKNGGKSK